MGIKMEYWLTAAGIYRRLPKGTPVSEGSEKITKAQYENSLQVLNEKADEEIRALESQLTPRRIREHLLGIDTSFIQKQEDDIVKIRAKKKV